MSLNVDQKAATRREFVRNFELLGITPVKAAADLGVSESRIKDIMNLRKVRHLEDAWVLRRYLMVQAAQQGVEMVPFTALRGNPEDYWFLDADRVNAMMLD
ncbi:DUF2316 family protein [Bifidobacterium oedipodis]|uniref:DUF2316 family protein n=1 Tax=Bifidobacterium oedipodis TaxID=2675322 RepID=A0A7Y0EMU2_9BIFI|nr:DUF2316 family protein [Bifidobacterium sp. DSM 109957]NMM93126.1 hypothetical protein [Bifidobacterium sp. DSM 109957]